MPKLPYLPLYTGDWLKDPALTLCAAATRGVWIDLLAAMHELDRSGELRGTADQLARIARCSTVEFVQAATELQATRAAEVTARNGMYCISNRRMQKDFQRRKAKEDENRQIKDKNKPPKADIEIEADFELFWKQYPKGRKNSKGTAREAFSKAILKADAATIIAAATEYAASDVGRGPFVKMPSTWLNQECWNDDREAWRDKDKQDTSTNAFRKVTREEFLEAVKERRFKDPPKRATSDPCWVFGTLTDGTRIECRAYWPPKKDAE